VKENNFKPKILYPAKLSFIIEREIKTLHVKQKLKQYMQQYQHFRRYSKDSYIQKMKINKALKGWE
jgi:hypothetical protein